uniref:Protein ABIL5 n=1 Tax=Kalanchoe fedtschenkoi TaxID=63787 RepID=A0A7N0U192_KALFE
MTEELKSSPAQVKHGKDVICFDKSLKELKDLRSQLHNAADYCESSFLNSKQKDLVVENTKKYICRAVITVVDHLGSASANFDEIMSRDQTVPEAEPRLDCLSQRLLACQQFSLQSALADLCWNPHLPRHNPRYLFAELAKHGQRANKTDFEGKRCGHVEVKSEGVVLKWPKLQNTGFEFQKTGKGHGRKLVQVSFHRSNALLSLIRGNKRISRAK